MAKHAKPRPPGKTRALVLAIISHLTGIMFIASGIMLGYLFFFIAALYLCSWKFEFND